ncbi:hypothetical protein PTSG_04838 [Salpingoeca rosetta]|uniref:Alpha-1,6-mannosyl-glycoprotein 2-beta-N-acetylglucosaminyltransferase n=1 Tax=Salpingoeca rosetta (strain ATCC 50818 / BSB-021) TaxID=946362 RepID=F2U9U8_SALR5|nr:uncharacterized protein PTSG_04838 [Salpingoeca rosetta]EGD73125.1 hypothetical protein PTSG_04838 [Salpingoeca rosetta]|eukprot:XP_004994156.1 hypothetical protein PTSG_04838 [Salpingoeca rosetta]
MLMGVGGGSGTGGGGVRVNRLAGVLAAATVLVVWLWMQVLGQGSAPVTRPNSVVVVVPPADLGVDHLSHVQPVQMENIAVAPGDDGQMREQHEDQRRIHAQYGDQQGQRLHEQGQSEDAQRGGAQGINTQEHPVERIGGNAEAGHGETNTHNGGNTGGVTGAANTVDAAAVEEVLFVMVSKKHKHLAAFLRSLERSDWPKNMVIVFSHDFHNSSTVALTREAKAVFPNSEQWLHPFACSQSDPAGPARGFPRFTPTGAEIDDWQGSCVKNHWWWAANKIWGSYSNLRIMYYLEEDFLVSAHAYSAATIMRRQAEAGDMLGFMLECRRNLWTVSGAMLRRAWLDIHSNADFFCHFNEYNWDLSVKQALIRFASEPSHRMYICAPRRFAQHTGDIGQGLTRGKDVGGDEEEDRLIRELETSFYAKTDTQTLSEHAATTRVEKLSRQHKGFKGFADMRYQHHCMHVASYYDGRGRGEGDDDEGSDAWIARFVQETLSLSPE